MSYLGNTFNEITSLGDYLNTPRIDIASASNLDLIALAPNTRHINITGTTTINSFNIDAGMCYFVKFSGVMTISNNASIITNRNLDITTEVGDTCIIRATDFDIVELIAYEKSTVGSGSSAPDIVIGCEVGANAMTFSLAPTTLKFRSSTLTSGTISTVPVPSTLYLTIPSGATLGSTDGQASRLILLALNVSGTVELAVVNSAGGLNLDETGVISTTAISSAPGNASFTASIAVTTGVMTVTALASGKISPGQRLYGTGISDNNLYTGLTVVGSQLSGTTGETGTYNTLYHGGVATSSTAVTAIAPKGVIYSATTHTNVPYRILGVADSTQATAGVWATAASLIIGGNTLVSAGNNTYNHLMPTGGTVPTRAQGVTYWNTSGRIRRVSIYGVKNTAWSQVLIIDRVSSASGGAPAGIGIAAVWDVPPGSSYYVPSGWITSGLFWAEF